MKKKVVVLVMSIVCLYAISLSQTKSANDWLSSAYSKYDRKDYREAIADYTEAIELKPNNAMSYVGRGLAKREMKDYKGAIADYTKAIELKPNYAAAYKSRGISYLGLEQKSKALADFLKAKKLGNNIPQKLFDMCK